MARKILNCFYRFDDYQTAVNVCILRDVNVSKPVHEMEPQNLNKAITMFRLNSFTKYSSENANKSLYL